MLIAKSIFILLIFKIHLLCPNEPFCRECFKNEKNEEFCRYCQDGYFDINSKSCQQKIAKDVENCRRIVKKGDIFECEECNYGFLLDIENKCLKCDKNLCAICNSNQECLACFDAQIFINNECSTSQKCQVDKCQICEKNLDLETCVLCASGFSINEKGMCVFQYQNCEKLDTKIGCLRCAPDYYIGKNNTCMRNKNSVFLSLLIWFIAISIFGGVIYYFYNDWSKNNQNEANTEVLIS